MDQKIHFRGYLTFDDSLKVQRAVKRWRVPPSVLVTVVLLAAVALVLSRMRVGIVPAFLLLAFLGTFLAVGYRLLMTTARRSQQKLYEQACIKRNGTLKNDGIHIKRGRDRRTIPWDRFDRAIEVDDMVAIVTKAESIGFARYMFNTESEWSRARDLIMRHYT
jgi:uncharacterized SAM-binding protein YcdF (DUF218 family)